MEMIKIHITPPIIESSRVDRLMSLYGLVTDSNDVKRIAQECDCRIECNGSNAVITFGESWNLDEIIEVNKLMEERNPPAHSYRAWILDARNK